MWFFLRSFFESQSIELHTWIYLLPAAWSSVHTSHHLSVYPTKTNKSLYSDDKNSVLYLFKIQWLAVLHFTCNSYLDTFGKSKANPALVWTWQRCIYVNLISSDHLQLIKNRSTRDFTVKNPLSWLWCDSSRFPPSWKTWKKRRLTMLHANLSINE